MMKNELIKQLAFFVITTTVLSLLFYNLGVNLILSVLLGIVLQYGAYNGFVYLIDAFVSFKGTKLQNEKLRLLAQQGTEVTCPCAQQKKEFVPIRLNQPNYYKCSTCSKTVGLFTAIETALVTEPIANTDISSIEQIILSKLNESTGKY